MNCKRARTDVALGVGGDLDDTASQMLERHLATCPECRKYRRQMEAGLRTLYGPSNISTHDLSDSVWPGLLKRLPSREEIHRSNRFNGWLPAAAVLTACLAVVALTTGPDPRPHDFGGGSILMDTISIRDVLPLTNVARPVEESLHGARWIIVDPRHPTTPFDLPQRRRLRRGN